jgi:murein DD-endopeptidase MepM/ murein hydrolase activator NlpD
MQNRVKKFAVFLICFSFLTSGCATGRTRGYSSRASADRIPAKQSSYRIRGTDKTGVLSTAQKQRLQARTRSWRWPTNQVVVTSSFGARGRDHHDGIDLRARRGTPVNAAAEGKVIYAGSKISGYGKMIVIRHHSKLSTIYAHNSKLLVRTGARVRRGQRIALSGNTGHSSGPHVHFEVREGITAINPLLLLPSPAVANEASRRIASGQARATPKKRKGSERFSQSSAKRLQEGRPAARVADGDGFRPRSPRNRSVN